MGYSLDCEHVEGSYRVPGRVSLETDILEFRGSDTRIRVQLRDITEVVAVKGILSVRHPRGVLHLDLGEQAEKWVERLLHPPSRLEKLGIQPGDAVRCIGSFPLEFQQELETRPVQLDGDPPTWILYLAETPTHLNTLPAIGLARGLWVVYPRQTVKESEVLQAGRSAGLTDTKVLRFSATHTGLKFVTRKKKPG